MGEKRGGSCDRSISIGFLVLGLFFFVGCAGFAIHETAVKAGQRGRTVEDTSSQPSKEAPKEYREALHQFEDQKFAEAFEDLEIFLRDEPTSPWTQVANFYAARSLEGLGRWSEAAERYRGVVQMTGEAPRLQAMALYRLSFCYEALGDDQAVVPALHDLLQRKRALPKEIADAELPARLAGAYARVGNFEQAIDDYRQAELGVARLRHESGEGQTPTWLPRTLYYMGSMALRKVGWDDFETALRPLARSQVYLLEASDFAVEPWSEKAATDLITTYNGLWSALSHPPLPESGDPLVASRRLQETQWSRAVLVLDAIHELQARALPVEQNQTKPSASTQRLLGFLDDLLKKLGELLSERPAGEGPTEESKARHMIPRGKVLAPDDSLERRFLEDAKREDAKKKPEPAAQPADPNL